MKSIKCGKQILSCEPYTCVLMTKERTIRCNACYSRADRLLTCSACKVLRYCNVHCQKKSWPLHKTECKCLQKCSPRVPTPSVLLFMRLIIKSKMDTRQNEEVFGQKRSFDDLVSHAEEVKKDAHRSEEFFQLCHTLKEFASDVFELPSADILIDIFGKMVINSFSICDGEMQPIGTGLYLQASILDHSCSPNAVIVFDGNILLLRSLTDIKMLDSRQVNISYIEQLETSTERRHQLRKQYYFTCQCSRCHTGAQDLEMTAFVCPEANCGGCVNQSQDGHMDPCRLCGVSEFSSTLETNRTAAVNKCQVALQQCLEWRKEGEFKKIQELSEDCLQAVLSTLISSNLFMIHLHENAMDAAIELGQWSTALQHGLLILKQYRNYYGVFHPSLGVHLLKIGKLQICQQQLEGATNSFQEAQKTLEVTHGSTHPMHKLVMELLDQALEERRVVQHTLTS